MHTNEGRVGSARRPCQPTGKSVHIHIGACRGGSGELSLALQQPALPGRARGSAGLAMACAATADSQTLPLARGSLTPLASDCRCTRTPACFTSHQCCHVGVSVSQSHAEGKSARSRPRRAYSQQPQPQPEGEGEVDVGASGRRSSTHAGGETLGGQLWATLRALQPGHSSSSHRTAASNVQKGEAAAVRGKRLRCTGTAVSLHSSHRRRQRTAAESALREARAYSCAAFCTAGAVTTVAACSTFRKLVVAMRVMTG